MAEAVPVIAIVDDDDAVRDGLSGLVRSLGYSASAFASAEEFLNSQRIDDTSCLITDVQMPGLSGLDLQDRLIVRGHRIPIVFITGHSDDIAQARAMKAGATAFLSKPINCPRLIGYLDKALMASDTKGRMSTLGQAATSGRSHGISALPPKSRR
jgi:FixJ family two-component response regulator